MECKVVWKGLMNHTFATVYISHTNKWSGWLSELGSWIT